MAALNAHTLSYGEKPVEKGATRGIQIEAPH